MDKVVYARDEYDVIVWQCDSCQWEGSQDVMETDGFDMPCCPSCNSGNVGRKIANGCN